MIAHSLLDLHKYGTKIRYGIVVVRTIASANVTCCTLVKYIPYLTRQHKKTVYVLRYIS